MEFSHETDELEFKSRHHYDILTTTIYLVPPPRSLAATTNPFITAAITGTLRHHLHHPLTTTPHNHLHHHLPPHFNLLKHRPAPTVLSVSHHAPSSFDKLLVVPTPTPNFDNFNIFRYNHIYDDVDLLDCTLFALYDGGLLRGCRPYAVDWNEITVLRGPCGATVDRFDDIVIRKGKIFVVGRECRLYLMSNFTYSNRNRKPGFVATLIDSPIVSETGLWWRKRVVVCGNQMYLVVRVDEKLFEVYKLVGETTTDIFYWEKVTGFRDGEALFIGRDCYFFVELRDDWYGRELENCIVFSEGAFPMYGDDCWEFSRFGGVQKCDGDIAVFRLGDGRFSREGENGEFPRINWVPPAWIYGVWSGLGAGSQSRLSANSRCQVKREPEDDHGFNSHIKKENNDEMQSDLISQVKEEKTIEVCSESASEFKAAQESPVTLPSEGTQS